MAGEETKAPGGQPFSVQVITPRGPVAEVETDAVTAPGKLGEFELLGGHLPFLTALRPGVLTLGESGETSTFAVGAGFLRVDHEGSVEILVEEALAGDEIDADKARSELADTKEELDVWDRELDADYQRIQYRHELASAQVEAHSRVTSR